MIAILVLGQQVDAYYDVRRRIQMLKELVVRHKELIRNADLRDDDELMALIEVKLKEDYPYENPDFGLKELSELIGTTQTRIIELFRRSPIHKVLTTILTIFVCCALCTTYRRSPHGASLPVHSRRASLSYAHSIASSWMPLA